MQLYVLIHHIIFWLYLSFLYILYFSSTPVLTSPLDKALDFLLDQEENSWRHMFRLLQLHNQINPDILHSSSDEDSSKIVKNMIFYKGTIDWPSNGTSFFNPSIYSSMSWRKEIIQYKTPSDKMNMPSWLTQPTKHNVTLQATKHTRIKSYNLKRPNPATNQPL